MCGHAPGSLKQPHLSRPVPLDPHHHHQVGLYSLLFGTDNIAIYVALFSIISVEDLVTVVVIFYAALLVYIGIAVLIIVQCPPVGKCIGDYAKYLVPLLLIGLGLYIVHDSIAWVIPDP